jgi:CRISPR-associated protein Cmr3
MKRLKNIRLLVDLSGLELPEPGMLKLGGEGKAVSYFCYKGKIQQYQLDECAMKANIFKLYISTPAVFSKGWLPEWIDQSTLIGKKNGLKVQLLTASITKHSNVGGFDMKEQKPKPMHRTVPAGSVYYFKLLEGSYEEILKTFHYQAISDIYPEQGYGISLVGITGDFDYKKKL